MLSCLRAQYLQLLWFYKQLFFPQDTQLSRFECSIVCSFSAVHCAGLLLPCCLDPSTMRSLMSLCISEYQLWTQSKCLGKSADAVRYEVKTGARDGQCGGMLPNTTRTISLNSFPDQVDTRHCIRKPCCSHLKIISKTFY